MSPEVEGRENEIPWMLAFEGRVNKSKSGCVANLFKKSGPFNLKRFFFLILDITKGTYWSRKSSDSTMAVSPDICTNKYYYQHQQEQNKHLNQVQSTDPSQRKGRTCPITPLSLILFLMIEPLIYNQSRLPMSATEQRSGRQEPEQREDQSSNLDYLVPSQPQEEGSKESVFDTNKKKAKDWSQKESAVKRVIINNRQKDKKIQSDSAYEGIYLYKPGVELPSLYQFANQTIKIIIASEYIKRHNPELLKRTIYGTDPYTSNSDAVCMLVHSGSININSFPTKRYEGVELICKVIKPKKNYTGSFKNGIMSRSLKGYNGNALKPEAAKNLTSLGPMEQLQRYAANMHIPIGKNRVKPRPRNISSIMPIPETHIVFNMNNQPAYKYSIFNIADKGFEKNEFMIKKLDNFVLYLETENQEKYELLKKVEMDVFDIFKFSKVKHPEKIDNEYFSQNKCPLDEQNLEILYPSLEWEEILWGNCSILLKDEKRIEGLRSFKYYKKEKEGK